MSDQQTVGSYLLLEKLGEGGMGEVYLAEHRYIARRAAIKFLLRDLSGSADLVSRFFAEARAASVIRHPGIVEVLDCDVHADGRAYIVMELLRGESLRDYLARVGEAGHDEPGMLAVFRQLALALAAAHAQDIVHRDLKPDNVYLHVGDGLPPAQPVPKILDFGIAKLMGREAGSKTRTGQLLGTPMYMSPEQCRGLKQIDHRSDIYSLGCIMYEVFCGRPPFLDEGFGDLIIAHVSRPPTEPTELAPGISPGARQVLLACLAKAPQDRPQSMDEVAALLTQAGAPSTVRLQIPVWLGGAAGRERSPASSPDGQTLPEAPAAPPRRAQTTPMPPERREASGRRPAAGASGAVITPSDVGRTRLLQPPATKTSPNTTLQEGASERFATEGTRRSGGGKALMVLGGLAAVAVVALVIVRVLTGSVPGAGDRAAPPAAENEATPAAAGTRAPEPRPASPGATATAPAPAPSVTETHSLIELTGVPASATIRLDGRVVVPPIRVARGAESHRLVVDARGYERATASFDGASDRTIAIDMQPTPGIPSSPAVTAKPTAAGSGKTGAHGAPGKPHKKSDHSPNETPGFKAFTDL